MIRTTPKYPLELPHRYVLIIESTAESDVLTLQNVAVHNYYDYLSTFQQGQPPPLNQPPLWLRVRFNFPTYTAVTIKL